MKWATFLVCAVAMSGCGRVSSFDKIDPITSERVTGIVVQAVDDAASRLTVRCTGSRLDIAINPNAVLGGMGSQVPITYRLDKRDPVTEIWDAEAGLSGATSRHPEAFLRWLELGDSIVIRVTSNDGQEITRTWNLSDIKSGIPKLHCLLP